MAKSVTLICNDINELVKKIDDTCITLNWGQFYEICDRERISLAIQKEVKEMLQERHHLHIIYTNNHVIVAKD